MDHRETGPEVERKRIKSGPEADRKWFGPFICINSSEGQFQREKSKSNFEDFYDLTEDYNLCYIVSTNSFCISTLIETE